jgi:hypothetical protein
LTTAQPASRPQALSPGLLFTCVLGLLVAGTAALWTAQPAMGHSMNIASAERPSADYYLAYDGGGPVDHDVLYFGIDRQALDHLRRADVLFLGNSRLMFAARPRVLDAFFETRGLRYYVLGFGFREADRFPLAIIEKFDLHPRYVIVNADGFFNDSESEVATATMRGTAFGAREHQWEAEASHGIRRFLHRLVPNWIDLFGRPGVLWRREVVGYRSRTNGTWQMSPWEPARLDIGVRDLRRPPLGALEVSAARRFGASMAARGTSLVLTFVPTPRPLGGGPALFAELLQAPLVTAHPSGIGSHDGDHLDEGSAAAWCQAFVRELALVIR